MSTQREIGDGWVESVDVASGRKYYANTITQATSWEWPTTVPPEAPADEWVAQVDPASGKTYYMNRLHGTTSWDPPESMSSNSGNPLLAAAGEEETPATPVDPAEAKIAAATAAPAVTWTSSVDPASGKRFYSSSTGETTWNAPPGFSSTPPGGAPNRVLRAPSLADVSEDSEVGPEGLAAKPLAPPTPPLAPAPSRPAMVAMTTLIVPEDDESGTVSWAHQATLKRANAFSAGNTKDMQGQATKLLLSITDTVSTSDLRMEVEDSAFVEYAEKNYNLDRKGMFGAKTSVEKITSWKDGKDVIKTSLCRLGDKELVGESIQSYRNITGFMGDRATSKPGNDHALKLLNCAMNSTDGLHNEIYCQIAKQTTKNPSNTSCEQGWQLLLICLATFPPGPLLRDHLMAHCAENSTNHPEAKIKELATKALHVVPLICDLGPRRELPTLVEMEALRRMQPLVVRVSFLDQKYVMVPADSWATAAHFRTVVCKRLGVLDERSFALYEVSSNDEERPLDASERILDLMAYWARLANEVRAKQGKNAEVDTYHLVFKAKYFFEPDPSDHACVEMMFMQGCYDVVDGRYPCADQDAITLAALQVQEEFGDHPSGDEPCIYLKGNIHKYVPEKVLSESDPRLVEEAILKLYAKLNGYSQQEARLSYLDYTRAWKIYGSTYFFAEPIANKLLPEQVVVAISNRAVLVVDPNTKEFLEEFPYTKLVTWGHSEKAFVIVAGDLIHQRKIYFKTNQGAEMNVMVQAYVDSLLEDMDKKAAAAEEAKQGSLL